MILLGCLSLATFGGPFLILGVIRGGASHGWPPDRPVEWWTFGGICALTIALLVACLASGSWARRRSHDRDG